MQRRFSRKATIIKIHKTKLGYVRCRALAEIYIEALLVDEELADQVWEVWDAGKIDNLTAYLVWGQIVNRKAKGIRTKEGIPGKSLR